MPSVKFRFNTECQVTLEGDSYEEVYLKFKDLVHGEVPLSASEGLEVCPPENPTIYFEIDDHAGFSTIETFKGDFVKDILDNCPDELRARIHHHVVRT